MPEAMPHAMLNGCLEQSTQRNATDERNVRHQDSPKSSSVPDAGKPVESGFAFAEFIDNTLRSYAKSGSFRAALHAETPGSAGTHLGICPPDHKHAETGTCYQHHGCRCDPCREFSSRSQKRARMRRARAAWNQINGRKTA
jgi:hypothetical protein